MKKLKEELKNYIKEEEIENFIKVKFPMLGYQSISDYLKENPENEILVIGMIKRMYH